MRIISPIRFVIVFLGIIAAFFFFGTLIAYLGSYIYSVYQFDITDWPFVGEILVAILISTKIAGEFFRQTFSLNTPLFLAYWIILLITVMISAIGVYKKLPSRHT